MKKRESRFGIRFRFVLTVSALILLASLALTVFFMRHEKELAREALRHRGSDLARHLAREIRRTDSVSRPERLQSVLDRFTNRESVVYCAIKDSQGIVLAETRSPAFAFDSESFFEQSYRMTALRKRVPGVPEPVWTASIGFVESSWNRRIASLRNTATVLTLLVVGVGVIITLLVVQTTVRPMRVLVDATRKIARGQLENPVEVVASGEIRDLSEALREMAFRLRQSHSQLEEHSRTLEKKVEDRTRELETRVRELSDSRMATLNILEDVKVAKTELEIVNQELLALDEMKSKFIGMISHELKTPFTAIKANIDFILSGRGGRVPENLGDYLQTVQRNTNRVRKIMEDFLTVAQIRSGRRHVEPVNLRLREAIGEYLSEIGPIDKKFQVKVDIPGNLLVRADRNRLHDVYVNLLLNALKFSPEGGEIRIRARPYDGQILSEVSDQGIGIPTDKLESIFGEFFQIDRNRYGGTGLGLYIVSGIIREHGGRIWVDSRPGEGSTFFFTLPGTRDRGNG
jgi:signal transduction histidine kinase